MSMRAQGQCTLQSGTRFRLMGPWKSPRSFGGFFPSESHPRRRIRFQAGLERVEFDRLWQTRARVEIFRARPYNL